MDDHIRISDADREQVSSRLRDHFAEGRLTSDELDERLTATLNAKTYADLRPILADLPAPPPAPGAAGRGRPRPAPAWRAQRRPPVFALLALLLLLPLVLHGGGILFLIFSALLAFWLFTTVAAVFAVAHVRRRVRRAMRDATFYWHPHPPRPY